MALRGKIVLGHRIYLYVCSLKRAYIQIYPIGPKFGVCRQFGSPHERWALRGGVKDGREDLTPALP